MKVCAVYDKASAITEEEKKEAADYYVENMEEIVYSQ